MTYTCWHWTLSQPTRYSKVSNRVCFCIYRIYIYFLCFYLIWEFKLIKCEDWNYPYTQIANVQCFLFLFPSGYISSLDVVSMWNSEMLAFVKNVVAKYYCYNFSRCTWGFQWRSRHFRGDSMRGILLQIVCILSWFSFCFLHWFCNRDSQMLHLFNASLGSSLSFVVLIYSYLLM